MAASLFATDVESLTPEGCRKLAEALGISAEAYEACVADRSTDASIDADYAEFKSAGGYALPTIWIGKHQLVGARSREDLAKALEDELSAPGG
jgi:2-hydroxychromene-2-carboxylate isomerase